MHVQSASARLCTSHCAYFELMLSRLLVPVAAETRVKLYDSRSLVGLDPNFSDQTKIWITLCVFARNLCHDSPHNLKFRIAKGKRGVPKVDAQAPTQLLELGSEGM